MPSGFSVARARIGDLDDLAPLFDAYRQFYGQSPNLPLARQFLFDRLSQQQSVALIARNDTGEAWGFVQLYPLFSSVSAAPIFLLNDLYVRENARRAGVARALLAAAAEYGRAAGAVRLFLNTAHTNVAAQATYERSGWVREEVFRTYELRL